MTTLQVSDAIARAVVGEVSNIYYPGLGHAQVVLREVVLRTLRERHVWFCKLQENVHGDIVSSQQMELWP